MKRDMNLIRRILLTMEEHPHGMYLGPIKVDGFDEETIGYHCHLIVQAGLADGSDVTHMESKGPEARLVSLTWSGHEFVDAARDDSRWRKATTLAAEKVGSVTIGVLQQLLVASMRGALGLP